MSASPTPDRLRRLRAALAPVLLACLAGCAGLSPVEVQRVERVVEAARPAEVDCDRQGACARPSALHELAGQAFVESTPDAPRHYTLLLDRGSDALLARVDLIRSATTSIDLQTYIFDEDDAGRFVLEELIAAARRGVRVRLLMDQLSALRRVETLAALAGLHANFEARIYNPVLGRAKIGYPQYVAAGLCCWRALNQRMHTKLLLVDGAVGITGGRNYQDDYYDWDEAYNFRDRDLMVAGPSARDMAASFEGYWDDYRSIPVQRLADVGRLLLREGVPALPPAEFRQPERVQAARELADDATLVRERLLADVLPVGAVDYVADPPGKHPEGADGASPATRALQELILGARERVMLQTPYLVLSEPAAGLFRELRSRPEPPRVIVSTNSLAATDAFIAYALSYKYKRRYLRELGFHIYEMKPFPADAPIDLATTGALDPADVGPARDGAPPAGAGAAPDAPAQGAAATAAPPPRSRGYDRSSVVGREQARLERARRGPVPRPLAREFGALAYGSRYANVPVPLKRAGVRMGLHAKSLVVDESVGVVGTHNFDPRGDHYNTEAMVVIRDPAFARQLAASIERDISPANSWVIAPRDRLPLLSGVNYSLGKVSEQLPVFDFWPRRYATSYEFRPSEECPQPLPPDHPRFRACYEPVGDFPEVALGFKRVLTRITTAFGAGLAPIL